jgi:flagellar biosynthesis chaperone FliJ
MASEWEVQQTNKLLKQILVVLKNIEKKIPDVEAPANVYGENLVEAIQNGIARGQQGIRTDD